MRFDATQTNKKNEYRVNARCITHQVTHLRLNMENSLNFWILYIYFAPIVITVRLIVIVDVDIKLLWNKVTRIKIK